MACLYAIQLELSVNPSYLVAGAKTELSLSVVLAGEIPKPTNFEVLPRTELLAKFTLLISLTSATSTSTVSKPIKPLEYHVEWPFTARYPSMISSNGSEFLPPFAILGWLGMITSWFLKHAGETELGLDTGIGELNLELSSELTYRGVESSLPDRLTFSGVRKICAQLRATSVTLAFGSTVLRGIKMSCRPTTSG